MAKLFFRYSTVRAGKSMEIYRIYSNYKIQGKKAICLVPDIIGKSQSRVGLETPSIAVNKDTNLINVVKDNYDNIEDVDCILVDEAQFLSQNAIISLMNIVDHYDIPVICYGLKNDFKNKLFEGSEYLLLYADKIEEVKTVCYFCNSKATMVIRIKDNKVVRYGNQIEVENNDCSYLPVCRKHWFYPEYWDIPTYLENN